MSDDRIGAGSWIRTVEVPADYEHPDLGPEARWHVTVKDSRGREYEIPLTQREDGVWFVAIDNSDIVEVSWLTWKVA